MGVAALAFAHKADLDKVMERREERKKQLAAMSPEERRREERISQTPRHKN